MFKKTSESKENKEVELSTMSRSKKKRRSTAMYNLKLKVIAEKQMTRMNSIAEVLTKAKKVNRFNEKDEIVNIDDILVQMAILQMKKCTHDLVFYMRICYGAKKWT